MPVNENSFIKDTRAQFDTMYWSGCLEGYGDYGKPMSEMLVKSIQIDRMTAFQRGYLLGFLFHEFEGKFNGSSE